MYTTRMLTQAVMQLSKSEREQLFELLTNHSQLLDRLLPGLPLILHVTKQQRLEHDLAEQYDQWLNTKT